MRESIGHDITLLTPLDHVVADRACRIEALPDVARLQTVLELIIEICPHTRQTVRLQLHPDLDLVRSPRIALFELHCPIRDPEKFLDVMPDFVREDRFQTILQPGKYLASESCGEVQ